MDELLGGHKIRRLPREDVKEQPLVRLWQLALLKLCGVQQVHPDLIGLETETRHLVLHLPVDCLLGLQPHDELVGGEPARARVGEVRDDAWHVVELDPHLCLAVRECLARLEHEGHALPPRVVHMQHGGGEGLGAALLVHDGRLLEVPGRVAAADVLAGAERVEGKRLHALEHLELLGADVAGGEGERLLHRHQCHHLQQVVLQHVADDAILVKVAAAPLRPEVLLEDDLHVLDVLPVPDALEADVGKTQHEQIHHQLLAKVVIDSEDLVLPQHRQLAHHLLARSRVLAKWLLQHKSLLESRRRQHHPTAAVAAAVANTSGDAASVCGRGSLVALCAARIARTLGEGQRSEVASRGGAGGGSSVGAAARAESTADGGVEEGRDGHVVQPHLLLRHARLGRRADGIERRRRRPPVLKVECLWPAACGLLPRCESRRLLLLDLPQQRLHRLWLVKLARLVVAALQKLLPVALRL
mmetsp:Transcript_38372/g.123851  ORF Transcript_38372/g.123851 Transcript_38372/m.123851 type:complete len:472 (+) Transcript_38372:411-1826(+)